MSYNPIDRIEEEADAFRGDVLNEEKMKRLRRIYELCQNISRTARNTTAKMLLFSDKSRNGTVVLDFPEVLYCPGRAIRTSLAEALTLADSFTVTCLCGNVRISFSIQDMWKEFHLDYGNGNVTERYKI